MFVRCLGERRSERISRVDCLSRLVLNFLDRSSADPQKYDLLEGQDPSVTGSHQEESTWELQCASWFQCWRIGRRILFFINTLCIGSDSIDFLSSQQMSSDTIYNILISLSAAFRTFFLTFKIVSYMYFIISMLMSDIKKHSLSSFLGLHLFMGPHHRDLPSQLSIPLTQTIIITIFSQICEFIGLGVPIKHSKFRRQQRQHQYSNLHSSGYPTRQAPMLERTSNVSASADVFKPRNGISKLEFKGELEGGYLQ